MMLSTHEIVKFLTEKMPLNAFLIGSAGAGKTYLIRELIRNLVGRGYIELYMDREYNLHEYIDLIKRFKAETMNIKRDYPFKSNNFIKLVKAVFKRDNSSYKLVIVDDTDRLIESLEEFIKKLFEDGYNYIMLYQDIPEKIKNLSKYLDYLIISPRMNRLKLMKILNMKIDTDTYLALQTKRFTWLIYKA